MSLMPSKPAESDLEVLSWVIRELYSGGAWNRMEKERPEINEVCGRLGVWVEVAV